MEGFSAFSERRTRLETFLAEYRWEGTTQDGLDLVGGRIADERRTVRATAGAGGCRRACGCCPTQRSLHSGGNRACLHCGQAGAAGWTDKQKAQLRPVPYFLVTFTVPEQLRRIIRDHPEVLLARLFQESAGTLQDIARHRKHLGAQLGLLGVLHTWTRQLEYHPHIHYLIPGGGLRPDGLRWCQVADPQFFLPERLLAARWRSRLRQALREDHPALYRQIPGEAWTRGWVVDVLPVGGGQNALQYLSAYIYKAALRPPRLRACHEHPVPLPRRHTVRNHPDTPTGGYSCRAWGREQY